MQEQERARRDAEGHLRSILVAIKRVRHCRHCDGTKCRLSDKEVLKGINLEDTGSATEEDRKEYHNQDAILEDIAPLEVSVRSREWQSVHHQLTPSEYRILLSWGGPAVQIAGDLDEQGTPISADLQYQDWFTEWESLPLTPSQHEALLDYARLLLDRYE